MRKLLLAGAAMLGATTWSALAQFAPSQGMTAQPWGGGPASNDASNAYGGSAQAFVGKAAYPKKVVPKPGTVVIRLNGRVQFQATAVWSPNHQVLGAKTNPINFSSYMRLYPGVDGMATNGLRYGAAIELRENFPGGSGQPAPSLTPAPSGSTYTSGQTVYVRRAFTYLAADQFGILRFGNGDGVIGLFDPGIFYSTGFDAGVGALNGAVLQNNGVTGGTAITYAWLAQSGGDYGNTKIVYLSPQFFGFDFGVQYAPSMGNGYSSCTTAGGVGLSPAQANCNSETTGTDATRWYNQVGVGVRYQGVFGPVTIGAYGFYETAGKESFFGPAVNFGRGLSGNRFDNLSFVSAAAYASIDTGMGQFIAAIDYIGGALNGSLAMRPTGGVPEEAVVWGINYRNGPVALGTEVAFVNSQGSNSLVGVSQRREFTWIIGGSYNLASGLYLVGEYQFTQKHQGGFDFITNANGVGATGTPGTAGWKAGLTRDTHGQGVSFATVVTW